MGHGFPSSPDPIPMHVLRIDAEPPLVRLVLIRGRGNALDRPSLEALEQALTGLVEDGAPPLLLTGEGRSFCTGLDLIATEGADRATMRDLMEAFHRALTALFLYPAPVGALLNGHALAGGAVLALAADRRWMRRGEARFGIHGARLGISYPDVVLEILRDRWPRPRIEEALYGGERLADHEALDREWVDAIGDAAVVEELARAWLKRHDGSAFRSIKRALRVPAARRLARIDPLGMDRWLDQWFDPETRAAVDRARALLKGSVGRREGQGEGRHGCQERDQRPRRRNP